MAYRPVPNEAGPYEVTGRVFSGSEAQLLDSLSTAKDDADAQRRADCERRIDMYEDDWESILAGRIKQAFTRENYTELLKVLDVSNNPLKRIVDAVSTIYDQPPSWSFEDESVGETWGMVCEQAKANVVMPELNRMVNVCNESLLYVCPGREGLRFEVITPDALRVWQDPMDPSSLIAFAICHSMADTRDAAPLWHYWSRDEENALYQLRDGFGPKSKVLKQFDNPYTDAMGKPVLPGVMYHRRHPRGRIWDQTSGKDLFEATILIGFLETFINHLIRTDAARQRWVSGMLDQDAPQVGGPMTLLQFRSPDGTPVNVGEFSSQGDWNGLGNNIARKLQNVLNNNGLSLSDFQITGDAQSGFSLRVRKEGLMEMRERQVPLYECYDLELYDTVAAVWNFERTNMESNVDGPELPFRKDAGAEITYAPFQTVLTVQEKAEQHALDKERLAMGLISVLDVYKRDNPGVTDEEAREAIEENKRLNREVGGRPVAPNGEAAPVTAQGSMPTLAEAVAQRVAARAAERNQQAEPVAEEDGNEG